jgi:hypothetical protein
VFPSCKRAINGVEYGVPVVLQARPTEAAHEPEGAAAGRREIAMELLSSISQKRFDGVPCLAESNEFALYQLENDTYALVHRHQGVAWQGVTLSGDALFRVNELLATAARTLYRGLASELSTRQQVPVKPQTGTPRENAST